MGVRMGIRSVLLAACLGLLGVVGPAQAQDEGPSAKCMMCHGADHEKMARHPHANAADSRNIGCVGCHGMSEKHAENPAEEKPDQRFKGKGALSGEEASAVCMMCHESQNNKKLLLWAGSTHPQAGVGCTSCHTIHVNKDPVFNKAAQPDVCFACHKDTRVQLNKPFRHPVQEGKVGCSDCHSPHGSAGPKLVKRDTTNATCYQCHAEKRGPFVHNHQPVQDNCAAATTRTAATSPACSTRATRCSATSATCRMRSATSARCAASRACCRPRCRRRRSRPSRRCRAASTR
jgi:DmsE family decaheme c-type cytochrome